MLAQKQVAADVEAGVLQGTAEFPTPVLNFRVTSPKIVLDSVHLEGVSGTFSRSVNETLRKSVGRPYREGAGNSVEQQILKDYLDAGYQEAKLTGLQCAPAMKDGVVHVTVSGRVEPGSPYTVRSATWSSTLIFSAESFAKANRLQSGQPVSLKALKETQQSILGAYQQAGYLDAKVEAQPQADPAAHTIAYAFQATPGDLYRMQSTRVEGLSETQQHDFDRAWLLTPGKPYDPTYPPAFLKNNTALRSLDGYSASYKTTVDPQTHLVSLVMTFQKMGRG